MLSPLCVCHIVSTDHPSPLGANSLCILHVINRCLWPAPVWRALCDTLSPDTPTALPAPALTGETGKRALDTQGCFSVLWVQREQVRQIPAGPVS